MIPAWKSEVVGCIYMRGIARPFDEDLAVMCQMFTVIFYTEVSVEKHIPNFFYFSFLKNSID